MHDIQVAEDGADRPHQKVRQTDEMTAEIAQGAEARVLALAAPGGDLARIR